MLTLIDHIKKSSFPLFFSFRKPMKISSVETFHVDAGWRPWTFVKISTAQGLTGYGAISAGQNPYGIDGTIKDLTSLLIGQDPRPYEMLFWDLIRATRLSPGGIAAKAIAGI